MKKRCIAALASFVFVLAWQPAGRAEEQACGKKDAVCREFAALAQAGRHDSIVGRVKAGQLYSEATKEIVGNAYLKEAEKESDAGRKETLYRNAVKYGATSAYMGLYTLCKTTDPAKADDLLHKYIATRPQDPAPYLILGELDFGNGKFQSAMEFLREARKVSAEKSGNLDWLLFKACFLAGDYQAASRQLDNSFSNGKTIGDLKALLAVDRRFSEMGKLAEFRKFYTILNGREPLKLSSRT